MAKHRRKRSGHGLLWWLFIGWWWRLCRLICYDLPKLVVKKSCSPQAQNHYPVRPSAPAPVYAPKTPWSALAPNPAPSPAKHISEKLSITPDELVPDRVLTRYLSDAHHKSPATYNYYEYHRAEFDCLLQSIPCANILLKDEKVLRNKEFLTPFEKTAPITKRTRVTKIKDFVVVDTETTGIKVGGNDIIEVSAVKFENFVPVSMFTTLLKPRKPIPAAASAINGITDEDVEACPRFSQIKSALQEYIGSCPVVAHNAAFDVKFLFVSGLEFPENTVFYDTLELSRQHIKDYDGAKLDSYKLADVCGQCGIYFDGAHRACADALATGLLFIEIVRTVHEVDSVLNLLQKPEA